MVLDLEQADLNVRTGNARQLGVAAIFKLAATPSASIIELHNYRPADIDSLRCTAALDSKRQWAECLRSLGLRLTGDISSLQESTYSTCQVIKSITHSQVGLFTPSTTPHSMRGPSDDRAGDDNRT